MKKLLLLYTYLIIYPHIESSFVRHPSLVWTKTEIPVTSSTYTYVQQVIYPPACEEAIRSKFENLTQPAKKQLFEWCSTHVQEVILPFKDICMQETSMIREPYQNWKASLHNFMPQENRHKREIFTIA